MKNYMTEERYAVDNVELNFELNKGQQDKIVRFILRGKGYTAFFTATEIVFNIQQGNQYSSLKMKLEGVNLKGEIRGEEQLEGSINYLKGENHNKWLTGISIYKQIRYREIYEGIDWIHYKNKNHLEHDFIIQPGVDPKQIRISFKGAKQVKLDNEGNLILQVPTGELKLLKPRAYQEVNAIQYEIASGFEIKENGEIGFQIGEYNQSIVLKIDPVLIYSTFLGGSGTGADQENAIAVDDLGNAYVVGGTYSSDFPTTPGAYDTIYKGNGDLFVTKINASGTALIYSTFIGGSSYEEGTGIALDKEGNAYVTGITRSSDFPTTPGAYDTTFNGNTDIVVLKLNKEGTALIYSTFIGGSGYDKTATISLQGIESILVNGIRIDGKGNAYVVGSTTSSDFPTTVGAYSTTYNGGSLDAFVFKLNATGTALIYSTFLGGNAFDYASGIAVDESGNAYVTGSTSSTNFPTTLGAYDTVFKGKSKVFITKLDANGANLIYSTFLGGTYLEFSGGIALDKSGNVYVAGKTESSDFPTTPGAYDTSFEYADAFITKINGSGTGLVYSTLLGGKGHFDQASGIVVDKLGNAYVTGITSSSDFPTTPDAYDSTFNGGLLDVFLSQLNTDGTRLLYSTFIGGSSPEESHGIAIDDKVNVYLTGWTFSNDFPTTPGAYDTIFNGQRNGFIIKIKFGCEIEVSTLCCNDAQNIRMESCEEYKRVELPLSGEAYDIKCVGRLLSVYVKLQGVCARRQMAVGVIVYELVAGQSIPRGFRAVTVDTSNEMTKCECNGLNIGPFEFVLTEEALCEARQFTAKIVAHYSDGLKGYESGC